MVGSNINSKSLSMQIHNTLCSIFGPISCYIIQILIARKMVHYLIKCDIHKGLPKRTCI